MQQTNIHVSDFTSTITRGNVHLYQSNRFSDFFYYKIVFSFYVHLRKATLENKQTKTVEQTESQKLCKTVAFNSKMQLKNN